MSPSFGVRPARAAALGLAAVVLGLSAHDAAGGLPVHHAPLLLAVGLGAAAVTALVDVLGTTRVAGTLGVAGALGAGQVVLHLGAGGDGGAMAGMEGMGSGHSPTMIGAHALVTLAVTAGIAGAEATVAVAVTLVTALAGLVRLVPVVGPPPLPAAAAVVVAGPGTLCAPGAVVVRIHPLRGPPLPS